MALRADDVDLLRDATLVERFQAGDARAFEDLYRRYFARLRRFCQRRVGDPHEAEELAQEAFVRALRAMPGFAGERRFYPWVTVIASRLCVDAHRRRDRTTPQAEIDPGVVIDLDVEALFASVDHDHVNAALDRLAPRHREVLELRERDGWSYQRIADHYDVTLGTVEALLHRARRALRREFEKVGGGLAALPGFGWLGRRLDGLRARASSVSDLANPLSAAVATAAIAAGSIAMGAGTAAPPPPPPAVSVAAPAASSGGPDAVTLIAATAPSSSATEVAAPTPPAPTSPSGSGRPPAVATDYESAREYNEGAPVRTNIGGTRVGLDPAAAVNDVIRSVLP